MTFWVADPEGATWQDWCASFILNNPTITNVPYPPPEQQWQDWALILRVVPVLEGYDLPDPTSFDHWPDWVHRLSGALAAGL